MKKLFVKKITLSLLALFSSVTLLRALTPFEPDEVTMKDGTHYKGLIIQNNFRQIILQQKQGDITLLKSNISRIDDVDDSMVAFTGLVAPGKLPPWRMMIQDFRNSDDIYSFFQVPAARISKGYLRNIPYLSYAVNRFAELDIYGNPDHPVCVSLGAYAPILARKRFQKIARQFLAGYLGSRADISTLYKLNLKGDSLQSGNFIFQVTPPNAPGAHGAWRLSVYDPARLDKARVSDIEYEKTTMPFYKIRNRIGVLRFDFVAHHSKFLNQSLSHLLDEMPDISGFYKTSKNQLKLIFTQRKKPLTKALH